MGHPDTPFDIMHYVDLQDENIMRSPNQRNLHEITLGRPFIDES